MYFVRGQLIKVKMVKLTMIARVTDGLPLAEGLDDGRDLQDAEFYKQQVKALFKNLSRGHNEASRMSVETGPYIFQYPPFSLSIYIYGCLSTFFLVFLKIIIKTLFQVYTFSINPILRSNLTSFLT